MVRLEIQHADPISAVPTLYINPSSIITRLFLTHHLTNPPSTGSSPIPSTMVIFSFASLDVLFLILALLVIPGTRYLPSPHPPLNPPTSPRPLASPYLTVPGQSAHSTPSNSPLPSPALSASLTVPTITLTPDASRATHRPSHKRKSVSFSLSSMDDLNFPQEPNHRKRPPTPFVSGPISPALSSKGASPVPRSPGSPGVPMIELSHNVKVTDSMGVQKSWLMA